MNYYEEDEPRRKILNEVLIKLRIQEAQVLKELRQLIYKIEKPR